MRLHFELAALFLVDFDDVEQVDEVRVLSEELAETVEGDFGEFGQVDQFEHGPGQLGFDGLAVLVGRCVVHERVKVFEVHEGEFVAIFTGDDFENEFEF